MKHIPPFIIRSFRNGNEEAFNVIFNAYRNTIYYYCLYVTSNVEDAHDCTQDIFMKIIESIKSYDEKKASFQTWVMKIAKNYLINFMKAKRRHEGILFTDESEVDKAFIETNREMKLILSDIEKYIGQEAYQLILLRLINNMTFDEISQMNNQSPSKVKRNFYAALMKVRKYMGRD